MLLDHQVALITGASRGIGRAIALRFASEGADIAFIDLKEDEQMLATLSDIRALGVRAKAYVADASEFLTAHNIVNEVINDFGRIDILVNNAGITRDTLLLRMSEQQWDQVLTVNLKSAFNFSHAVAPQMLRQRYGNIISLSSVVGEHGNAGQTNYAASKAGIIGLTKSIAKELGGKGIRVNAIAPGFILTDMTKALGEDRLREIEKTIPLRRGGEVEEVAKVALFLASDLASYVTGQVISCCGGMNS